jgi:hypothetical protein
MRTPAKGTRGISQQTLTSHEGPERCAHMQRCADGAPLSSLARDAPQIQPSRTHARAKGVGSGPVGQPAQGRPCVDRGAASAMCKRLGGLRLRLAPAVSVYRCMYRESELRLSTGHEGGRHVSETAAGDGEVSQIHPGWQRKGSSDEGASLYQLYTGRPHLPLQWSDTYDGSTPSSSAEGTCAWQSNLHLSAIGSLRRI